MNDPIRAVNAESLHTTGKKWKWNVFPNNIYYHNYKTYYFFSYHESIKSVLIWISLFPGRLLLRNRAQCCLCRCQSEAACWVAGSQDTWYCRGIRHYSACNWRKGPEKQNGITWSSRYSHYMSECLNDVTVYFQHIKQIVNVRAHLREIFL